MNDISRPSDNYDAIKKSLAILKTHKRCECCDRMLPKTDTYWITTNGSFRTNCKACLIKKKKAVGCARTAAIFKQTLCLEKKK